MTSDEGIESVCTVRTMLTCGAIWEIGVHIIVEVWGLIVVAVGFFGVGIDLSSCKVYLVERHCSGGEGRWVQQ